ncbi:MAG TPA: Crp/Fnr family transcriptional regulator, partial [Chryseobacterium sp.]|nr:Crp/Fnr family transcriptional regulator [Chryseobacterium sp.]
MSLELRKHFEELIPLTDEEFATLASYFNLRKLKKHQYLIQENEPITNIY